MSDTLTYYWNYFVSEFSTYPTVIKITVAIILFLAMFYISAMFRIIGFAFRSKRDRIRTENIDMRLRDKLNGILFNEKDLRYEEIQDIINPDNHNFKPWEKKLITTLILELKANKDYNKNNYKELLAVLPLLEFWEGRLRQSNFNKNKSALRNIDSIGGNVSGSMLSHRVHSKHNSLRKLTRSEYLKYAEHDNFKFLYDDFDQHFNAMDEIRIHDALKARAAQRTLPLLIRWVHSAKNPFYKAFLIKEIGYFKQKESAPLLVDLYKESRDNIIKAEIATTLGVLRYEPAIAILAEDYHFVVPAVQYAIIQAMGDMNNAEALAFLEGVYPETQNNDTLLRILRNMFRIDRTKSTAIIKRLAKTDFEKAALAYEEKVAS